MAEPLLFVLMAIGALAGAVAVVVARNPVHSAMGLMGTLFSVAVLYVLQLAHLVAAVQIIVYAGAVMTLFLFVIMMIGVDKREDISDSLPFQRVGVAALTLVIVFFVAALTLFGEFDWVPAAGETNPSLTNGTVQAVAEPMFTRWVLAFEATALLLTIAAAGAVALAQYRRRSP
ncbi:MAG: NADH-quinone oxidoreductase subunit J [Acidimicrobiia bacterium]